MKRKGAKSQGAQGFSGAFLCVLASWRPGVDFDVAKMKRKGAKSQGAQGFFDAFLCVLASWRPCVDLHNSKEIIPPLGCVRKDNLTFF
jgi:hypothetical protein